MGARFIGIDQMIANIDRMEVSTMAKVHERGQLFAGQTEGLAQAGAPWTDRTGHARRSITGSVEMDATLLRIALAIGADYGNFLEGYRKDGGQMVRGHRYATVWPTITRQRSAFLNNFRGVITK